MDASSGSRRRFHIKIKRIRMRLHTKLTLLFFGVILIPLVLTHLFFVTEMHNSLYYATMNNLENLAISTSREIKRFIESERDDIIVLSRTIGSNYLNNSDLSHELETARSFYTTFDEFVLLDPEGNIIISVPYVIHSINLDSKLLMQLKNNVIVSDEETLPHSDERVIMFSSPVYYNNTIIGIILGYVSFQKIWDILKGYSIGETGYVYLIDEKGVILSHPDKNLVFHSIPPQYIPHVEADNLSGFTEYIRTDNKEMIGGYASILGDIFLDKGFWCVIAVQQTSEAFSSLLLFRDQITFFIIIVGTIFIITGVGFSYRITKPIQKLKDGARRIASGDLSHHVEIKSGDELEDLASTFNAMTDALYKSHKHLEERTREVEKLLRQKEEFINQLGHDLKNPLVPILNVLPVVINKTSDPEIKKLLLMISDRISYIKRLIISTLKLAKLRSSYQELSLEEFFLFPLIEEVIQGNKILAEEKNISIKNLVDRETKVYADKLQIEEVLQNLISNALKFTDKNGRVEIGSWKTNEGITIWVSDTGIGLTEEQINHIFDEFYKADPSRHDLASSGLGLSIAKRIVEKHGGKIWAESPGLGKGSTFYFTLPNAKKDL